MYARDLEGQEFVVQATTTLSAEKSGNQELSGTIFANKTNEPFIHEFGEMWEIVDDEGTVYKVVYSKPQGKGNSLSIQFKAIPLFFDTFQRLRIYEEYNEHMTAQEFFNLVFADTGFTVSIVDSFYAVQWEGLGKGSTRLEMFQDGLKRYGAEFRLSGDTVYLETQIGRDTSFMYRHKLNASNISKEIDASELYTYAKGFGDFEEGEEANAALQREYRSPLADIIGERHAPPIYDGRVTQTSTMDDALEKLVKDSLKVSVSADIHDLRKQGYPLAQPMLGDRVFLIDERIGMDEEVRVQDMNVTREWKGEVIDLSVTLGSSSLSKRHQSNMRSAITNIDDILSGRKQLPYNAMDAAVQRATKALQSAQTELEFGSGILARDPNDPNRLVVFNSAGLGVSVDGGQSFENAITYLGINTNLLTAGQINANNIQIIGEDGLFYWDGNGFTSIDPNDPNKRLDITPGMLDIKRGAVSIERPDGYTVVNNGVLNLEYSIQFTPNTWKDPWISHYNRSSETDNKDTFGDIAYARFRKDARYLKAVVAQYVLDPGDTCILELQTSGNPRTTLARSTETTTSTDFTVTEREITVDLGVPDGQKMNFYVAIKSKNGGRVRARINEAWLEG